MNQEEKIERGHKARDLFANEFFNECFDRLEARYVEAWRASSTVEMREDAHKYVRLIEWLKEDLRSVATTGALEEQRLAALRGEKPAPISLKEFKR